MYAISYGRSLASALSKSRAVIPTTSSIPDQPVSRFLFISAQSSTPNSVINNFLNSASTSAAFWFSFSFSSARCTLFFDRFFPCDFGVVKMLINNTPALYAPHVLPLSFLGGAISAAPTVLHPSKSENAPNMACSQLYPFASSSRACCSRVIFPPTYAALLYPSVLGDTIRPYLATPCLDVSVPYNCVCVVAATP